MHRACVTICIYINIFLSGCLAFAINLLMSYFVHVAIYCLKSLIAEIVCTFRNNFGGEF